MKSGMRIFACTIVLFASIANAAIKSKELTWQLPDPGSHAYKVEYSSTENKAGKAKELHMQYQRVIEMHKTETGFSQEWIDSEPTLEFIGYATDEKLAFTDILNSTKDLNITIALNKDGAYESIQNIAEISAAMKTVFEKMFSVAQTKALEKIPEDKREAAKAEADKRSASILTALTSPAMVKKQIEKTPYAYSFFNSGGLDPEQAYELDNSTSNPFGGEPFPVSIHFEISLNEDDPGYVHALYQSTFNQDKGRGILIAAIKKMLGESVPDVEIEKVFKEFELSTEFNVRISLETGVVQELTYVETKQFPNSLEIETTAMTIDTTSK